MSKILILGGAGFIGYHLSLALSANHKNNIFIIDNLKRGVNDISFKKLIKKPNVKFKNLDLSKEKIISRIENNFDYIFQFAAIIGVQHVLNKPYDVLRYNYLIQDIAISIAKNQKKLKAFIFTSTSEVYAGTLKYFQKKYPTPETINLTLTDIHHPRTSYMSSKIYGELMSIHSGLPYIIFRPHNIYGTRMGLSHVIPELLLKIRNLGNKKYLDLYSPDHKRSFCFISDAIEMMIRISFNNKSINNIFNIGNNFEEVSIKQLAHLLITLSSEKDYKIKEKISNSNSPYRRLPDMKKSFKFSGYKPKISLYDGCKITKDWYLNYIFNNKNISAK